MEILVKLGYTKIILDLYIFSRDNNILVLIYVDNVKIAVKDP